MLLYLNPDVLKGPLKVKVEPGTEIGIGYLYRCWVRVRVLDRCLGAGTVSMYRTHVPHYPCTVPIVPMYRTHRTHHTYPASDRSSNRFFKIKTIFIEPFGYTAKNILNKSAARSVANRVRMVGTVGTLHGYGTQYLTYVPKCRTYVPMYRTMRTLFTVPLLLSKPYLKKVANRALLLKIDKLYYIHLGHIHVKIRRGLPGHQRALRRGARPREWHVALCLWQPLAGLHRWERTSRNHPFFSMSYFP